MQDQQNIHQSNSSSVAKILLMSTLVLGVPACSTLPKQMPQPIQNAFDINTSTTSLAKIIELPAFHTRKSNRTLTVTCVNTKP